MKIEQRKRTVRILMFMLSLVVLVAGTSQPALALYGGSESTGGDWLQEQLVPDAKGTKLRGVLTIFQKEANDPESKCSDMGGRIVMYYFMRLQKGEEPIYGFSGKARVCLYELEKQKEELDDFVRHVVVPAFFRINPDPDYYWAHRWKSAEKIVSEDPFQFPDGVFEDYEAYPFTSPLFLMMDVVLAVKEECICRH